MRHSLIAVLALALASSALAQPTTQFTVPQAVHLNVRPAAAPVPALRYALLPPAIDQVDGDAAKFYISAMMTYQQVASRTPGGAEVDYDAIDRYTQMPLSELPREKVAALLARYADVLQQLEVAARCNQCRWDSPIGERGIDQVLLDQLGYMRSLARLLLLRARLQIAEKQYDQALRTMQAALALARDLNNEGILVQQMVAAGNATLVFNHIAQFTQQPDAPNLYWALASLPRPFIDPAKMVDREGNLILLSFPALLEAARDPMNAGKWEKVWEETKKPMTPNSRNPTMSTVWPMLKMTAMRDYSVAKKYLISTGISAEQVEKMPVAQVAGIYFLHAWRSVVDEFWKWWLLPFWQADEGIVRAQAQAAERQKQDPGNLMALIFGIANAPLARTRANIALLDRQIAALQCVEALRAYAAAHDGKLPASLDLMPDTPAPIDPVTGKPFIYRVDGKIAILESPAPKCDPRPASALRYEITM